MSNIFSDYTMKYLKEFYASEKPLVTIPRVCRALCSDTKMKCFNFGSETVYFATIGYGSNCHYDCDLCKEVRTFADVINTIRDLYVNAMNVYGDSFTKERAFFYLLSSIDNMFKGRGYVIDTLLLKYKISFGLPNSSHPKDELDNFITYALYGNTDEDGNPLDDDGEPIYEDEESQAEYEARKAKDLKRMKKSAEEIINTLTEITG